MAAFTSEQRKKMEAQGTYGAACAHFMAMSAVHGPKEARFMCLDKYLKDERVPVAPIAPAPKGGPPPPRKPAITLPPAPTDPALLIDGDDITGKQCSFYGALMWASENLHTKDVRKSSAPSSQAWSLWSTYSRDHATHREFWNNFGKHLIPNKAEIELKERFKDDGGIAEAIDEIRKLSEESMVEAFLQSRSEASYRQFTVPP